MSYLWSVICTTCQKGRDAPNKLYSYECTGRDYFRGRCGSGALAELSSPLPIHSLLREESRPQRGKDGHKARIYADRMDFRANHRPRASSDSFQAPQSVDQGNGGDVAISAVAVRCESRNCS